VRGQLHAPAALYPGKDPIPIVQDAGWVPGPVWTGAENLAPTGMEEVPAAYSRYKNVRNGKYRQHISAMGCIILGDFAV